MKFCKKMTAFLLTAGMLTGVLGNSTIIAQAAKPATAEEAAQAGWCPGADWMRLMAVNDLREELHELFDERNGNHIVGVVWNWQDKYNAEENRVAPDTQYFVDGNDVENFWMKSAYYFWGNEEEGIQGKFYEWVDKGWYILEDNDDDWRYVGEGDDAEWYILVPQSEVLASIAEMKTATEPYWDILFQIDSAKYRRLLQFAFPDVSFNDSSSKEENKKEDSHVHSYVEVTVQEATAMSDTIITYQCTICGQQKSHEILPGTAIGRFISDVNKKIEEAPVNGSITIDTDIWTCFNRSVIESLKKRQDVTMTVNFRYKGIFYTFTIPAGYGEEKLDALVDENGYCGFLYLLSTFGGQEKQNEKWGTH